MESEIMVTAYQLAQRCNMEYPNNGFIYKPDVNYQTELQEGFIALINSALAKSSKEILLDDYYEFPTIAGQSLYDLPQNCEQSNVLEVTRTYGKTPVRCRWARDGELMEGNRYFNAYGNMIGIFPTPFEDNDKITIFFKKTPRPVKTKDDPIEVNPKWLDILVYSMVIDMASSGSNPDIEIANNYTARYNALLQEATLDRYGNQPYYPKIKDNKRPPIRFYRRGFRP